MCLLLRFNFCNKFVYFVCHIFVVQYLFTNEVLQYLVTGFLPDMKTTLCLFVLLVCHFIIILWSCEKSNLHIVSNCTETGGEVPIFLPLH